MESFTVIYFHIIHNHVNHQKPAYSSQFNGFEHNKNPSWWNVEREKAGCVLLAKGRNPPPWDEIEKLLKNSLEWKHYKSCSSSQQPTASSCYSAVDFVVLPLDEGTIACRRFECCHVARFSSKLPPPSVFSLLVFFVDRKLTFRDNNSYKAGVPTYRNFCNWIIHKKKPHLNLMASFDPPLTLNKRFNGMNSLIRFQGLTKG